jgi:aspartyl/glutamyl-tRNA(Asn/Gln) amidotransferase C subunit
LLAAGSRLEIKPEDAPGMLDYMRNFLRELNRMNRLDLANVREFDFHEDECVPLREDEARAFDAGDSILAESPGLCDGFVKVPRIMEE